MYKTGSNIEFLAEFTNAKTGATGLTVTVKIYKPDNTLLDTYDATEIGNGLYSYTLNGASVTTEGLWKAIFITEGTVDCNNIAAVQQVSNEIHQIYDMLRGPGSTNYRIKIVDEVGAVENAQVWITNVPDSLGQKVAGTFITDASGYVNGSHGVWLDTDSTIYIWVQSPIASFNNPQQWLVSNPNDTHVITGVHTAGNASPTFSELCNMLRIRLNDTDGGVYTDDEIKLAINEAYIDTQMRTDSFKMNKTINLTPGVKIYEIYPIYTIFDAKIGENHLERYSIEAMKMTSEWDDATHAQPYAYIQTAGGMISLFPIPDSNYVLELTGYGVSTPMVADLDTPFALPAGHAAKLIIERAESIARGMRPTSSNNVAVMQYKDNIWAAACDTLREQMKGIRR